MKYEKPTIEAQLDVQGELMPARRRRGGGGGNNRGRNNRGGRGS